jgi:tripartite-type tricarboxylate transporter receptor subunit TctC
VSRFSHAVMRLLALGTLMAVAGSIAAQQDFPSKPIRLISPYAPGGSTSVVARLIGQKLTESWGQPVIVDNRPGANTIIGSEAMVKSPPDGYTILIVNTAHVINPNLFATPYDAIKDFAPVATLVTTEYFLALNSTVPANTLKEFIALAKSKPNELNYASAGTAGAGHLATELFNLEAGIKTQHVPYKGTGPALNDLIGGQVQFFFAPPIVTIGHIKSGRLKALAITGETRSPSLPQIPTFAEAGLPSFDVRFWQGILAPDATPRPVVDKLSTEISRILTLPDVKETLATQGMTPLVSTPERFGALLKADLATLAKVIKTANIKLEQ